MSVGVIEGSSTSSRAVQVLAASLLALAGAAMADAPNSASVIEVEVVGEPHESFTGSLHVEPAGGGIGEPYRFEFDRGRTFELAVPDGSFWKVRAEAAGNWAADELAVGGGRSIRMRLFPTGGLAGTFRLPPGASPPASLRAHFRPPLDVRIATAGTPLPEGSVDCPVVETTWTCELPAGTHDLRLHAPGFASVLAWDVAVSRGESRSLPPLSLVPGAAVVGRVELLGGDANQSPTEVEVELRPAGGDWRDRYGPERLEDLFRTVEADERGFFQFVDVTPGVYRVEARAEGRVPAVVPAIEVVAGMEADLGPPLVVALPSALIVFLDPPVQPGGETWEVRLVPVGGSEVGPTARTDGTGAAVLSNVQPGEHWLSVEAGESRWHRRRVEVLASPSTLEIRLPLVPVTGTVSRDGEPVRARIDFGGTRSRAEEIALYADFEGRFSGHLPAEGEWPIAVVLEPGGAEQRLAPVTVERRPGAEAAVVDLELADTRVNGTVVDSEGAPAERVIVLARQEDGSAGAESKAQSDHRGRFRFLGLPPGRWGLTAIDASSAGAEVGIDLVAGEPAEVRIVLSREREVRGRVTSARGLVAGATIMAFGELAAARQQGLRPFRTGPDGSFTGRVPADAVGVHLAVMPPGFAARLLYVPLPPSAGESPPIEVFVEDFGGMLVLDPADHLGVWLVQGRARVPFGIFHEWRRFHRTLGAEDGRHALPWMQPGPYQLCSVAACETGALAPGGTLLLTLASEERDEVPAGD